jgi:flagellar assembly protein FliH
MHSDAKKSLGVEAEEKSHLEEQVSREVEVRVQQIREKAYQEGFIRGQEDGKSCAEKEFFESVQPQFDQFVKLLSELDSVKGEMYLANEQFLIQLIFQISKTVLLTDLKHDRNLVKRLTAQIIEKIGAKENIRLRVSQEDYKNMEGLRDFLKVQFPELKNIQIDPSDDMLLGGVKIETDLSRINASVEAQLIAIHDALVLGDT